jgi:hypothetical protein
VKPPTNRTHRHRPEPNPTAIIGGILALGVTRVLARAKRERDEASLPTAQASALPCCGKRQPIAFK